MPRLLAMLHLGHTLPTLAAFANFRSCKVDSADHGPADVRVEYRLANGDWLSLFFLYVFSGERKSKFRSMGHLARGLPICGIRGLGRVAG